MLKSVISPEKCTGHDITGRATEATVPRLLHCITIGFAKCIRLRLLHNFSDDPIPFQYLLNVTPTTL